MQGPAVEKENPYCPSTDSAIPGSNRRSTTWRRGRRRNGRHRDNRRSRNETCLLLITRQLIQTVSDQHGPAKGNSQNQHSQSSQCALHHADPGRSREGDHHGTRCRERRCPRCLRLPLHKRFPRGERRSCSQVAYRSLKNQVLPVRHNRTGRRSTTLAAEPPIDRTLSDPDLMEKPDCFGSIRAVGGMACRPS